MRYNVAMEQILSLLTVLLFIGWRVYWSITEKKADREKPKTEKRPSFFSTRLVIRYGLWGIGLLLILQLLFGLSLLPMPQSSFTVALGFLLVLLGLGLAVVSRDQLSTNWANAWEYQIKEKHELITHGVYSVIRHPIYTGIAVAVIGAELVAQSYLFIFVCGSFFIAYQQGKKEDGLLEAYFGKPYREYKKRTKMLIPFLF